MPTVYDTSIMDITNNNNNRNDLKFLDNMCIASIIRIQLCAFKIILGIIYMLIYLTHSISIASLNIYNTKRCLIRRDYIKNCNFNR